MGPLRTNDRPLTLPLTILASSPKASFQTGPSCQVQNASAKTDGRKWKREAFPPPAPCASALGHTVAAAFELLDDDKGLAALSCPAFGLDVRQTRGGLKLGEQFDQFDPLRIALPFE